MCADELFLLACVGIRVNGRVYILFGHVVAACDHYLSYECLPLCTSLFCASVKRVLSLVLMQHLCALHGPES